MFTQSDFAQMRFLEGRWKGIGPDGAPFYEEYDFPAPATLRSRRFPDAQFAAASDGSTVTLEAGTVMARWGEFTWMATEVADGVACFAPVNAPSSFCWRRTGPASVEVVQRWQDEHGKDQAYTVPLVRLAGPEGGD